MTNSSNDKRRRKTRTGVVVGDKMNKTVVVEVTRTVLHPTFHKYVRRRKRFMAHDEENKCRVGDTVVIVETRPLSRRKNWRVRQVLKEAALPGGTP